MGNYDIPSLGYFKNKKKQVRETEDMKFPRVLKK